MVTRKIWDGAKLAARMKLLNKNGQEVGDAVGVTRQVVSNWCNGIEPREERRQKVANALGCDVKDFYSEVQ